MGEDAGDAKTDRGIPKSRISRRTLIKGGAVLGGAAWVAPAIESFVYRPAIHSKPTPLYGRSGLTVLYLRRGVLYWTFIGQNEATCDQGGGSISHDDSFTTTCGSDILAVNTTIRGVMWNGVAPIDDTTCYFQGTRDGANLTPAGVSAGVSVLAWIVNNGTFTGATPLGMKGHFAVQCGSSTPHVATNPSFASDS